MIRYFANPSTKPVRDCMRAGLLDCIVTPLQGNHVPAGAVWCADNGCFGAAYVGDAAWVGWLAAGKHAPAYERCAFAVAPDVVANAAATLARSTPWLPIIRDLGYPVAFAAQDGQEELPVPWALLDVLFIGGSTEWKLGPHARALAAEARWQHGKVVHMGRVNSEKRLRYAARIGCHSADGTYISYGPDRNLPRALRWLEAVNGP